MEKLNKDEIVSIAILLDFPDILNLCKTNKKIERFVCKNNDFWRRKVSQKFPEVNISDSEINDWKEFYIEYSLSKMPVEKYYMAGDPQYIKQEFVDFLLEADFGIIPEIDIPFKYLIASVAKQKILTTPIARKLLSYYLEKNGIDVLFRKYFGQYIKIVEEKLKKPFENRYSHFTYFIPYLFEEKPKFKKKFKNETLATLSKISAINYKTGIGKPLIM